ncbi:hypothetical protein JCM19237_409 [Photobacterium aphoticum]|uniref:Uncharacterized protein n=1 Tax=Photobacterium aphoticum TaxID=754436 RepID=A0A090R0W1_9GAMM|nr:hypothetical protein JCM19237_409 [Photobacterium aphoticum]
MSLSFPPHRALAVAIIGAVFTSHAAYAEAPVVQVRTAYNSDLQVPLHYAEPVRLAQVLADGLAQLPKRPVAADTANATTGTPSGTVATTVSNNAIYWTNSAFTAQAMIRQSLHSNRPWFSNWQHY